MAGPHQPRQPDDGHDQGDPSEEEQRVGDVELRGVVMSGVVVPSPFSVLGGGWKMHAAHDHEGAMILGDAEAAPLDVGVTFSRRLNCVDGRR
jgi:hypothetical protein